MFDRNLCFWTIQDWDIFKIFANWYLSVSKFFILIFVSQNVFLKFELAGVASGATRAALTQHFALQDNAADISAKV